MIMSGHPFIKALAAYWGGAFVQGLRCHFISMLGKSPMKLEVTSPHDHSCLLGRKESKQTNKQTKILLNHTLPEHRSPLEHGSASIEPDIVLMFLVHHGRITAHIVQLFPFDMLTQVNTFRLRCSGIVVSGAVLAVTTLSLRDVIVVLPLV